VAQHHCTLCIKVTLSQPIAAGLNEARLSPQGITVQGLRHAQTALHNTCDIKVVLVPRTDSFMVLT
jgi:hypothetical protein